MITTMEAAMEYNALGQETSNSGNTDTVRKRMEISEMAFQLGLPLVQIAIIIPAFALE